MPYIKDIFILWILTQDHCVSGLRVTNLELLIRTFLTIAFFHSSFRSQRVGKPQSIGNAVVKLSSSSFCINSRTWTRFWPLHPPRVDKNRHFAYYLHLALYKKCFCWDRSFSWNISTKKSTTVFPRIVSAATILFSI